MSANNKPAYAWSTLLRGIAGLVCALLLWEVFARSGLYSKALTPPLWTVAIRLKDMLADGAIFMHTGVTILRVIAGLIVSFAIAVPMGMLMGTSRTVERMFSPLLSVLMPIPSLAWVPLFVLWLGIGNSSTILVVIYASVFTLTYNTWTGARAINQIWTKSAFVMGANSRQLLWHVMLPGTMLGPTAVGATIVPVFGGISEAPMELITGGDLDGDGFGDLVASTVFEDGQTFAYALRVLYGGPDGVREGPNLPSAPGPHRVRILPDVDGDGRDELVVLTDVPREAETGPETDTRDETGGPPFVPTVVTWELEVWSVAPTPVRRQAVPAGTALAGEAVGIVVADLTGDRSPEVILAAPGSLEGPVLKVFATVSDCDDHDPAVWRGCP